MSSSGAENAKFSHFVKNIYSCQDKHSWYSEVAEAYEQTRPRYPESIMLQMQQLAKLHTPQTVLEIGSGPGIATVELAKLGLQLVCLEPSLAACQLAQRKCAEYSQTEFINSTFEEWQLEAQKFEAVIATTSFHWITPGIRTQKIAAALKNGGSLILLWNTPPQPSCEVFQSLKNVYQAHAPKLAEYESFSGYEQNLSKFGQEIIDSGYFTDLVEEKLITNVTYSVDDYLTLLSTLSSYIGLDGELREKLFTELKQALQSKFGGELELSYLSMLQVARKS